MNNKGLTGLFVVLAFMALLLTACYEAEIENVTGSTDDLESITSVEDIINSLDIEGTHVMLNLTDQITVDADITDNSLYEDVTFDIYSIDKAEDIVSSDSPIDPKIKLQLNFTLYFLHNCIVSIMSLIV